MIPNHRWQTRANQHGESPRIDAFLREVEEVSKRHGLSISHEDTGGAFIVREHNTTDAVWLFAATDDTKE